MQEGIKIAEIGKQYAEAHWRHYREKDLRGAFALYKAIIAAHPDSPEAGYSRSQVQHIIHAVVPKQELLDGQMALLSACFARGESEPSAVPAAVGSQR